MCIENQEPTIEQLTIRCERQRERANRQQSHRENAEKQVHLLNRQLEDALQAVELLAERNEQAARLRRKMTVLEADKKEKYEAMMNFHDKWLKAERIIKNLIWDEEKNAKALSIGERWLERRQKAAMAKRQKKIDQLTEKMKYEIESFLHNPISENYPEWLDRSIRRYLELASSYEVEVKKGGPRKPIYWGFPIYNKKTLSVSVGFNWLKKHALRLAKSEAEKKVR